MKKERFETNNKFFKMKKERLIKFAYLKNKNTLLLMSIEKSLGSPP